MLNLPLLADASVMLLERHIDYIPYAANTSQRLTIRLRPNMLYHIMLHIEALVTNAGPGNSFLVAGDAPWSLIRNITITTPRGEILKNVSGRQLHLLNMMEMGTNELNTLPPALGIETLWGEFDLRIPFYNYTGINSNFTSGSTILNTNEFTELYITINWGNGIGDLYFGGAPVLDELICDMIVLEREPINTSDELEPRKKLIDWDTMIDQSGSDHYEYLIPENTLIKTIMITTYLLLNLRPTANQNALLRVAIEDDDLAHSLREWTGAEIKSQNQYYYNMEPGQAGGIHIIEFDQLRDLSSCYKTFGINYPKLTLDFDPAFTEALFVGIFVRQVTTPPALTIL